MRILMPRMMREARYKMPALEWIWHLVRAQPSSHLTAQCSTRLVHRQCASFTLYTSKLCTVHIVHIEIVHCAHKHVNNDQSTTCTSSVCSTVLALNCTSCASILCTFHIVQIHPLTQLHIVVQILTQQLHTNSE